MRLLVLGVLSLHKCRREPMSDSVSGKLYRCRSTEVAVLIIFILLPLLFNEIANIDILETSYKLHCEAVATAQVDIKIKHSPPPFVRIVGFLI